MYINACNNRHPILPKIDYKSKEMTLHDTVSVLRLGLDSLIINYPR